MRKIIDMQMKIGEKAIADIKFDLRSRDEKLHGSCDSFVNKTDVHFPTDINLLYDAIRKMITLIMGICFSLNMSDWRQGNHLMSKGYYYSASGASG